MRYVRSPEVFLADSIFSSPLQPRMLTNPRTVCFCQPVASVISPNVAPLARFRQRDHFRLLVGARFGCAPFWAVARREAFVGELLRPGLLRSHGRRLWRNLAGQMLDRPPDSATALFRSVNFFTGFRSSKGATPAKLLRSTPLTASQYITRHRGTRMMGSGAFPCELVKRCRCCPGCLNERST
jgi:hypothetical protein